MKAVLTSFEKNRKTTKQLVLSREPEAHREMRLIMVHPEKTDQVIRGFGGAFTDAAGYVFSHLGKTEQEDFLNTYFGRDGLQYTYGRISLDSSDFGTEMYAADNDPEDIDLQHMDFSRGDRYVLPLLQAAQAAAGRKLKLMLSPWSPPAYMKTNGLRTNGGKLKQEYAPRWAQYICKTIEHYLELGLEIELLSSQNEPLAVQSWDSCIYEDDEERDFIRDHLGPALEQHGLTDQVTLVIWDHNKEHVLDRADSVLCDAEMRKLAQGVAFHWYSGDHFENVRKVHEQYPDHRLIFSEGCVEHSVFGSNAELVGAVHYAHELIGDLNAGTDTFLDWNLLLDANGGPNHKRNFCDAPVMVDPTGKKLQKKLSLDYIGHFSKHIQSGALCLGISRFNQALEATAARNPDGTIATVVLNTSKERMPFVLQIGKDAYAVELPPQAIITCVTDKQA